MMRSLWEFVSISNGIDGIDDGDVIDTDMTISFSHVLEQKLLGLSQGTFWFHIRWFD